MADLLCSCSLHDENLCVARALAIRARPSDVGVNYLVVHPRASAGQGDGRQRDVDVDEADRRATEPVLLPSCEQVRGEVAAGHLRRRPPQRIPGAAAQVPTLSLASSPNSARGRASGLTRRRRTPSTWLRASSRAVIRASSYSGNSHPVVLGAANVTMCAWPLRSRSSISAMAWP